MPSAPSSDSGSCAPATVTPTSSEPSNTRCTRSTCATVSGRLASSVDPPVVVAVDAALGPRESIGMISLRTGGLRPGHGVGKSLPYVGDLAITATVNIASGAFDAHVLQSTRLFLVQALAKTIGVACCEAMSLTDRCLIAAAPRTLLAA